MAAQLQLRSGCKCVCCACVHQLPPAKQVALMSCSRLAPAVAVTEEDQQALSTIRGILGLLGRVQGGQGQGGGDVLSTAAGQAASLVQVSKAG